MTAQYIKTLMRSRSLKKRKKNNAPTRHGGKKTSCLKNQRSAAENILSQHCQNHKENRKNTSYESMSTTANQVTGGGETQDGIKKPFKNRFPEKGRPVLNTVQKSLEQSSIFLSSKI